MMMNTSPCWMVKFRSCISTKLPNAMVRSRTVMWALASVGAADSAWPSVCGTFPAVSNPEDIEHDREDAARGDDEHDAGDHRRGRGLAYGGGAVAALHAAQAPGNGDEHAIHRGLEHATDEIGDSHRLRRLIVVDEERELQHGDADRHAAKDAEEVGVQAQQRHHQAQR